MTVVYQNDFQNRDLSCLINYSCLKRFQVQHILIRVDASSRL